MAIPVIAVECSENRKLGAGQCSATYVSQASCPPSCAFLDNGCYAEAGLVGIQTARLNRSKKRDSRELAREEARAIATLEGTRPLRLHVVGDCRTESAARAVAAASRAYTKRGARYLWGGQPVWTYTHAWRQVPKIAWRGVSVLASVETIAAAHWARLRGYAAALVVDTHKSAKAWRTGEGSRAGDLTIIPCPAQTLNRTCAQCKLCFNADALWERRAVIAFEAHGSQANKVRRVVR